MSLVKSLLGFTFPAFACFCVSTTVAQAVILGLLFSSGTFTSEKMLRYAAVVYGLDLTHLPVDEDGQGDSPDELMTRDQIILNRVERSQLLKDRQEAVVQGISGVRTSFSALRVGNSNFEERKDKFEKRLKDLEQQARDRSLNEIQRTLSVLKPKQAKQLVMRMLADQGLDPDDDVMQDVVTIINEMSPANSKKLKAEFKSEAEQQRLQEILVRMSRLKGS